jgi:hypothetical protein
LVMETSKSVAPRLLYKIELWAKLSNQDAHESLGCSYPNPSPSDKFGIGAEIKEYEPGSKRSRRDVKKGAYPSGFHFPNLTAKPPLPSSTAVSFNLAEQQRLRGSKLFQRLQPPSRE